MAFIKWAIEYVQRIKSVNNGKMRDLHVAAQVLQGPLS